MIKFQNQPYNYDMHNNAQMPSQAKYPMQGQRQKINQASFQETFGQQQQYQQQQQQNNQIGNYPQQGRQLSQQQQYSNENQKSNTYQQQYQQALQKANYQQSISAQPQQQKAEQKGTSNQQQKDYNQLMYRPMHRANEQNENQIRTQKNSITQNQDKQNSSFMQGQQKQQQQQQPQQNHAPTRLQSADPTVLQNKSNLTGAIAGQIQQQKNSQYISNGGLQNKAQYDNSQRQATPMKDQMKFQNQKSIPIDQQIMYSPMPKGQMLSETANLAKLQQQQLLQNRSPQIQKVGGSSQGQTTMQNSGTNAQQLVEELAKEKEKHNILQLKLKKLENDKKIHNTQFLNDMEGKIKNLIHQNDQLQTQNMDLLQKAQDQPFSEIQDLNKQITYNTQQNEFLQKQIGEAQSNLNEQIAKYQEIENQYKQKNEQEEQQIQYLVQDLEDKVHGLISENERLNSLIQQQDSNPKKEQLQNLTNEKSKLIQLTSSSLKETVQWKQKYEQLQQKIQQIDGQQEPQEEQVENLEDKIRNLIEENDYLNSIVQQQIEKENQIALLEEEMQNLVEQNDNLEMLISNNNNNNSK